MPIPTGIVELSEKVAAIFETVVAIKDDIQDIKAQQKEDSDRLRKVELDQAEIRSLAADSVEHGNRLSKLEEAGQVTMARLNGFDRRMTVWGALCAVVAAVFGAASGLLKSLWG
jgi:predicted  nucleic acid-binding Zn-ribbon protein